jgi:hypothetical protein
VQAKMAKSSKIRASRLKYVSTSHVLIPGFETPFEKHLDPLNRWVVLAKSIPWDRLVNVYMRQVGKSKFGTSKINPRIVLGAMIIKHYMGYTDRETVEMIKENVYMQYFVGLSSFSHEAIFDSSLFVTIRKRIEQTAANEINELVIKYWKEQEDQMVENEKLVNEEVKKEPLGSFLNNRSGIYKFNSNPSCCIILISSIYLITINNKI